MTEDLDAITAIMEVAFDPAYGEGWTRRQVADALVLPGTHYSLMHDENSAQPCGFTLSRSVADEEELLLIAVRPDCRGKGIGTRLLHEFCQSATQRGAHFILLEMREGNSAEALYKKVGFKRIGRRPDYYRCGEGGPFDAITFKKSPA